jgi:hypothetical protein
MQFVIVEENFMINKVFKSFVICLGLKAELY